MKRSLILVSFFMHFLGAQSALADLADCRTWNSDSRTPSECRPLITIREMEHGAGSQYVQSDNLFELFVVLGPHDELAGVQYIKNRASNYGPQDMDHSGGPRLNFKNPTVTQLEVPNGFVMNDNHQSIRLGINPGFDVAQGGEAFINFLMDGITSRRAVSGYHLGRDGRGDWSLYVKAEWDAYMAWQNAADHAASTAPQVPRPIASLAMFTNYGLFGGTIIGIRNITPEFRP